MSTAFRCWPEFNHHSLASSLLVTLSVFRMAPSHKLFESTSLEAESRMFLRPVTSRDFTASEILLCLPRSILYHPHPFNSPGFDFRHFYSRPVGTGLIFHQTLFSRNSVHTAGPPRILVNAYLAASLRSLFFMGGGRGALAKIEMSDLSIFPQKNFITISTRSSRRDLSHVGWGRNIYISPP